MRGLLIAAALGAGLLGSQRVSHAQSVGLPAPRLLTTMPMGGTVGTQVEITITGEHLDGANELTFSDARLTATRKLDPAGAPVPNQYIVTIPADCPPGLYEAHVRTRLGMSASRIFSVGTLPEVLQKPGNTSLANAMPLAMNTLCNSVATARSSDFYTFEARQGQRVLVDVASRGIDSKMEAVLVVADAAGRDLVVERSSGAIDYRVPADGKYVVKVHELTYQGGPAFYYRLSLRELAADAIATRHPSTRKVSAFSWPPAGLPQQAALSEVEPNNDKDHVQKITLPCDISGAFAQAADVDVFEFDAKMGEVWWVEVASERLGRPTDPSIIVQQVTGTGADEKLTDVAELTDIPSPVKVSSNGYAYDGPPYDAGSPDIIGKVEIKQDGRYRLQITDLFGGTRTDPRNVYRMVIRKAAPDFAVVAWAQHMELRNGDRNALSKPIALRGGATMALEVVAVRRDGYDGPIEIAMEGLPEGVTAHGLKIDAGKTRGQMLISARQDAPGSFANVTFTGRAVIDGTPVIRQCWLASHAWPIPDSWGEIPAPRLLADVPVSVSGVDLAPITIAPASPEIREVTAAEKITIPLVQTLRSEFQGASTDLRAIGCGFESAPKLTVSLTSDKSEAVFDLAALKLPPGDYLVAFQGSAVAKYRHHPEAVAAAEEAKRQAEQMVMALDAESKKLAEVASTATPEAQAELEKSKTEIAEKQKAAAAALAAADEKLKQATAIAQPQDIVDIVTTEPIALRVKPAESK
ncbi:MAG: serine protease [Planctomycetaceae bacterium]